MTYDPEKFFVSTTRQNSAGAGIGIEIFGEVFGGEIEKYATVMTQEVGLSIGVVAKTIVADYLGSEKMSSPRACTYLSAAFR